MKKLLTVCCVCKKKIPDTHPRFCGLNKKPVCMGCEGVEIDVWHVMLPGEPGGFRETNLGNIIDMLNECEPGDGYTIKKERMRAGVYYNLPEFEGF